jgi:hypothetical protein
MTVMNDSTRRWPWFAIALALYPPLHVAAANPGQVEGAMLALVLATVMAASVFLLVTLRFVLGNWLRAGLGVAWFVLLFFSYGPINAALGASDVDPDTATAVTSWSDAQLQLTHSAIWLLLLALGWLWLRRFERIPARLLPALNLAAALLLGLAALQWAAGRSRAGDALEPGPQTAAAARAAPDIYFIVLDGYARADMLASHYGFDNGPFLRRLEQLGFQVAEASEANYGWTFLSLGSTLNMGYLPELLGDQLDPKGTDREHAYRLLRNNRVATFLRARGYRYVHLQSTWGGTGSNPFADEFRTCGAGVFRDDYLLAVAEASWLRVFNSSASLDLASCHLRNFETLAGLALEPGPKFVLAHFVPPHHPYLFDRDGRVLRNANLSNQFEFQKRLWEEREPYVEQLVFMSRRIGETIDRLVADSERPPVIVLVSDHGPNLRGGLTSAEHYRLRLASLSAVRLPGAAPGLFPEDVSNVNLMRIVLNRLFDAGLPRLPDRRFVSTFGQPFDFTEVDGNGVRVEPGAVSTDNM